MKTISTLAIAAIIGSVAMHGADARLGRRLSPWGNGHSGRGPSSFDPTQGWFDEADQSVGSPWGNGHSGRGPSSFDPTQGWFDEADQSVGSPWGNGHSGRGPSSFDPTQGWFDEADQSVGSPWGNGHSGRGPSSFDPTQGWFDEADQSVGSPWGNGHSGRGPSSFDPTQGWFDEADQSVGRRLSSSWLYTLATAKLNTGPTGSCVATTLGNMDRLGIPSFSGGTTADPNNSRGAMVQMIKAGRWTSKNLPGSRWTTIRSPYGTVGAYVIGADAYERMAYDRQIPSGAIIFQTRHGWTVSSSASGNDMGIVRDRGRYTFNYKLMNPVIYSDAKEVVILIPK